MRLRIRVTSESGFRISVKNEGERPVRIEGESDDVTVSQNAHGVIESCGEGTVELTMTERPV